LFIKTCKNDPVVGFNPQFGTIHVNRYLCDLFFKNPDMKPVSRNPKFNINIYKMIQSVKISRIAILITVTLFLVVSCNKATLPKVKSLAVSQIQQTNAYSGGQVTSDGDAYITARGVCWNTTGDPTTSDSMTADSTETGVGSFICQIKGLTPSTLYYVRAFASNSEGTAYGETVSFTTLETDVPSLVTSLLKSVTLTSAAGGGNVSNDGGVAVTARGVCWNTTGIPTIGDNFSSDGSGSGIYTSSLTDLAIGTKYYVRAYATNSLGTGYGNEVSFTQMEPVLDADGNAYGVVTIGTQVWLGENLKTTKFNDGTSIPYVTAGQAWTNMTTPAFCFYENNESGFKNVYGGLYNWYAVASEKLCPAGWHVPSTTEFSALLTALGGDLAAGGKLKETGYAHWTTPNLGATNTSGFTGLPGGGRYSLFSDGGAFADEGLKAYMWSSTEANYTFTAFSFDLTYDQYNVYKSEYSKSDGGSVRCLKNNQ
jgi:uncharacterized protein (TIGR02145 family)